MKWASMSCAICIIAAITTACEGKMQKMSNTELAKKHSECVRNNPTSPGRVTACENIKKECEARRKKKVFYGC